MILIAIKMLVGDRTKWLGVVLGSFLCTFLITHMLSMFTGMMRRTYALVTDIPQAEVWVMDPAVQYVDEPIAMSDNALVQVRGVDGVGWAVPLFTGTLPVRLPNGGFQGTLVVGVDDATLIGLPEGLVGCAPNDLRRADAAFVDVIASRTTLAMPTGIEPWAHGRRPVQYEGPKRPLRKGDELMVNDHRLLVTGMVDLGPRFLAKPVLYTTYSRAVFMSPRQRSLLSYVLVKAAPGRSAAEIARQIEASTGLRARTSKEFCDDTYWYYMLKTGVVSRIVFMISTAVVVGLSVSSLLFYLFTMENAQYYAVLKAMGATSGMLTRMIVVQALLGTNCGLGIGLGVSCLLGRSLSGDAMPYAMVWQVIASSSGAIVLVTVVASIISVRRIVRLEPAMVFK